MTAWRFVKLYPLADYDGPKNRVYRATPPWPGHACFVRRVGKVWETASIPDSRRLPHAVFSACPAAGASDTRLGAVQAWDYYHNR